MTRQPATFSEHASWIWGGAYSRVLQNPASLPKTRPLWAKKVSYKQSPPKTPPLWAKILIQAESRQNPRCFSVRKNSYKQSLPKTPPSWAKILIQPEPSQNPAENSCTSRVPPKPRPGQQFSYTRVPPNPRCFSVRKFPQAECPQNPASLGEKSHASSVPFNPSHGSKATR